MARRLASMLVTLFGVSVLIFLVLRLLPGNAVTAQMGVSAGLLSHAQRAALDHFYGVGQPVLGQFGSWLGSVLTGNFGISLTSRTSVASLIGAALPVTLELAVASMIIGELIGVLFGVFGALRPRHLVDSVGQGTAVVGLGVPSFVIGTGLVTFLASVFHYFPSSRAFASFTRDPWLNLQQIFFPALTLG
ncbi:MAG: ABC transporter permease, partial [Acidimicrobiales bacterium]